MERSASPGSTAEQLPSLVCDTGEVARLAEQVHAAGAFAFDLEFVSEGRYVPVPALLQIAWGDPAMPHTALIDWTEVEPTPLLALIADPAILTIAHAARQDLGLLATRFGVVARGLRDSQIAAAFVGMGDQIGYGKLIELTSGRVLDKGPQFTRWLERPLSARQLRYAVADVRYLPAAWQTLSAQLEERGRLGWVEEESAALAAVSAATIAPEEMWRELKGARGLRGRALAAVVELAAWRERRARGDNLPPSWVLQEAALLEIARALPADLTALRAIRGLGEAARQHGAEIVACLAAARDARPPVLPPDPGQPSPRAERSAAMIAAIMQALAEAAAIGARFVGTRADADAVARWYDARAGGDALSDEPDMSLFRGWRRQVAGAAILGWLRGELGVVADAAAPGGLRLAPIAG